MSAVPAIRPVITYILKSDTKKTGSILCSFLSREMGQFVFFLTDNRAPGGARRAKFEDIEVFFMKKKGLERHIHLRI